MRRHKRTATREPMQARTVLMSRETWQRLDALAVREDVNTAEIVRRAVAHALDGHTFAIAHLDAALAKLNPAPLSRHNAAQDVAMALEELDPGHMTRRAKAITADELIRAQTQREDTP
jgi:predicted transcriptional regulator